MTDIHHRIGVKSSTTDDVCAPRARSPCGSLALERPAVVRSPKSLMTAPYRGSRRAIEVPVSRPFLPCGAGRRSDRCRRVRASPVGVRWSSPVSRHGVSSLSTTAWIQSRKMMRYVAEDSTTKSVCLDPAAAA
jgi:hypothetical protein